MFVKDAFDDVKDAWDDVREGAQGAWEDVTGKTGEKAAREASAQELGFQQQALDYLKEAEAVPRYYDEQARAILGSQFGLPGPDGAPAAGFDLVEMAQQSPLYKAIMDSRNAGEQSILRNASATGRLRTGGTISDLAGFNRDLQNKALMESYNQQLGNLGMLMGGTRYAPQIANTLGGMGRTTAGGTTAAAQSGLAGTQNVLDIGTKALGSIFGGGF